MQGILYESSEISRTAASWFVVPAEGSISALEMSQLAEMQEGYGKKKRSLEAPE